MNWKVKSELICDNPELKKKKKRETNPKDTYKTKAKPEKFQIWVINAKKPLMKGILGRIFIVGEICSTEIWSTDFDYSPEKY